MRKKLQPVYPELRLQVDQKERKKLAKLAEQIVLFDNKFY